ncbi:helix-turn-helix domain-containing protein [Macrococcoides caseolyticum]|uniref:Transcriptional regulator n=1 Tax=Macrococcoides caseolyticum TaxID=69966 RepID=A0ACC9MPU7_9STAP|nr:S24 family peptidase [Macrococcus caseolyticus]PKE47279.1 transcriptional regulator [Macrococcus caseolyticus]PKE55482.1 transcriptional regulator [Macrococcus caseolyticus]PKF30298.1 transcriptional regulator [Macrococcus caseolyticus]TDM23365.1 helix-turn-helix domain-containing protein [Macrococcus caseolyticus]
MQPDLKGRRKELGLTLEQVGEIVGVGKSTVRKWEDGQIANMGRDKISKLAEALRVSPMYIMGLEELDTLKIPVVAQVSAGLPVYSEQDIIDYAYAPAYLKKNGRELFYLKVTGDSMDKEFKEGDLILVDMNSTVENGQIGVVQINGYNATVKRVKYDEDKIILLPESNNSDHLPQIYTKDDKVKIIGRVISAQKQY